MKYIENDHHIWYDKKTWLQGWKAQPHFSINARLLYFYYLQNQGRWIRAFNFLSNAQLDDWPMGTHHLDGTDVYVKTEEYLTKDEADSQYEAHREYADIQYLVTGTEKIAIVPLTETKLLIPYNEQEDIAFYTSAHDNYFLASPTDFFIFFPSDAHRPCVKIKDNVPVKKIIVKVKLNTFS